MKGRQPGRPTNWVRATVREPLDVGKRGVAFVVWKKWKRTDRRLGTLTVNVAGLAWRPANGKKLVRRRWRDVAEWFES